MNKLVEELTTQAIASFDAETRFRVMASSGDKQRALEILDRLDRGAEVGGN